MSNTAQSIGDISDKGIYAGKCLLSNKNAWGLHHPPRTIVERHYDVYVAPEDLKTANAKDESILLPYHLDTIIQSLPDGAKLKSIWAPLASWESGEIDGKWFLPPMELMTTYFYPLSKIESLKSSFEIVAKPKDLKAELAFQAIDGTVINYEEYEFEKIRAGHYLSSEKIGPNSSNESAIYVCMRMADGDFLISDEWTPTRVRLMKLEPVI